MRTIGARALVGGGMQAATRVLGMATAAVTVPLLARHLGPAGYGRFTIVLSLVMIVGVVAEMGLPLLASRDWPSLRHDRRPDWLADFWSLRWVTTAIVAVATMAVAIVLPVDGSLELAIAAALIPVILVRSSVYALFLAELDPWPVARAEILDRLMWVGLVVVVVGAGGSLALVLAAVLMVHLASLGAAATPAIKRGLIVRPRRSLRSGSRVLLGLAGPLMLIPLLGAVYARSDALILALVVPQAEVGIYGAIWRIAEAALAIAAVGAALLLPKMSRSDSRDQRRHDYVRTLRVLLTIYLPGAVFIALLAEPLLRIVGGREFVQSVMAAGGFVSPPAALAVVAVVIVLMSFGITNGAMMVACHRQGALLRQLLLGVTINLPLVWLLAGRWSFVGAAIAALVSEMAAAVHGAWVTHQELGPIDAKQLLSWPVLIASAVGLAMLVSSAAPTAVTAGIGITVAAALGWMSPARRDLSEILSRSGEEVGATR